jgi:hypothetical protein
MIRLTIIETADLIKRPYHWVYDKAKKLGIKSVKILDIDSIYKIFYISCLSRGYEDFNYAAIAKEEYKKLVNIVRPISKIKEERNLTSLVFYEILFAEKVIKPHIAMFNIIAYLSREMKVGGEYTDKYKIKKYICYELNKVIYEKGLTLEKFYEIKHENLSEAQKEVYVKLSEFMKWDTV